MSFDPQYYISEQYLHDDILKDAEAGLNAVQEAWKVHGRVTPFVISWVQEPVVTDDGLTTITDHVVCDMPEDKSLWTEFMVSIVQKTKPYALLMGEQRGDEVVIIFETKNGTRSWRYPIKKHGRAEVLGEPSTKDNIDCIGLLWRAKKALA
jgi:hypothetical protein